MPDPTIFPIDNEAPTVAVIGAVSAIFLAANPNRVGVDLTNLSSPSEAISLGLGVDAVDGSGKVLTTYGSTYHMGTANLYLGAIYAICPSGGMDLGVSEETRAT